MSGQASVTVHAPKDRVWDLVTDFENAGKTISAIVGVKVLHRPESGIVGLKWEETRVMFGKEATETMWINNAETNSWYETTALNCGCEYTSRLQLEDGPKGTTLSMSFVATPKIFIAKVMSPLGFLFRGMIRKAIQQDLHDMKTKLETV